MPLSSSWNYFGVLFFCFICVGLFRSCCWRTTGFLWCAIALCVVACILTLLFTHLALDNYRYRSWFLLCLLYRSFLSLLSVCFPCCLCHEWQRVLVAHWSSGPVGFSQLRFVGVCVTKCSIASSFSGFRGLCLCQWCLFFQQVLVVLVPIGTVALPADMGSPCSCGVRCSPNQCRWCLCL